MPPRKVAANSGEKDSDGPKAVEFRILDAVLKTCTPDDKPKSIDFELMTKKLGFKNIVVAKKRWSQVCKSNGVSNIVNLLCPFQSVSRVKFPYRK